jgi:hypothetical protein
LCVVLCVLFEERLPISQRSLLGLSRDLSHLQQRTRHFVHFSSVTWPRNFFHHCIVSESLCTNFTTNFFTVNVPFTFFPSFLFSCIKHLPFSACKVREGERERGGGEKERERKNFRLFFPLKIFTIAQLSKCLAMAKNHSKFITTLLLRANFRREKVKISIHFFFLLAFFTSLNHLNG